MLRIGKKLFSWNSTKFRMAGKQSEKITSIDLDEKITAELVYGNRRDGTAHGTTSGKYEPGNIALKMLVDEWYGTSAINPGYLDIITLGKTVGMSDTEFDLELQFFEEVVSNTGVSGVITIYVPVVRVVNPKQGAAVGTTGSEVEVSLQVIEPIQSNGAQLASLVRSFSGL